jgi:hypothetical protein
MTRILSKLLVLGALVACSDDGHVPPATASTSLLALELTVPPELTLEEGAAETLVDVDRLGLEGPLTVTTSGLPEGLEVEVEALSESQARLRFEAVGEVELGLHPTYVIARVETPEGLHKGATPLAIRVTEIPKIKVAGRVLDALGIPLGGVQISVAGAVVMADADGRFVSETLVEPPYQVVVREGPAAFHVFDGLTRANPTLHLVSLIRSETLSKEKVTITVNGLSGARTAYAVTGVDVGSGDDTGPWGGALTDTFDFFWHGGSPPSGEVHALTWDVDPSGQPSKYVAYGHAPFAALSAPTSVDVAVASIGTGWLAGEVIVPADHALVTRTLWAQFGPRSAVPLAVDPKPDGAFTVAVPDFSFPLGVELFATQGTRQTHRYLPGLTSGAYLRATLPEAPRLVSPTNASSVARSAVLRASAPAGAIRLFAIATTGMAVGIYTTGDSVALPSAPELGLALPAGGYKWLVSTIGPYETLDAFADDQGGLPFFGLGREVTLGYSELEAFVLAD